MDQISTYSISKLQKALELSEENKDYFLINIGQEPLYTDEPFRTLTHTILLLRKGELCFNSGLVTHTLKAPAIITVAPTVIRSFSRTQEKPDIEAIFFTDSFLVEHFSDVFFLNRFAFFEDNEKTGFLLDKQQLQTVSALFNLISSALSDKNHHEKAVIRHLICILIYEIDCFHRSYAIPNGIKQFGNPLFQKFRSLVTKEFLRQRSVTYYADKLNVTPKHLSVITKTASGMTAGEWIDKAVLLEAKVLLQNGSMNIAQISDYLNFSDQSIFGKYFKNLHGSSPAHYRKSLDIVTSITDQ